MTERAEPRRRITERLSDPGGVALPRRGTRAKAGSGPEADVGYEPPQIGSPLFTIEVARAAAKASGVNT